MAALRATPEGLAEIRDAYPGMERAADDLPFSVESDLRFHLSVLETTHNVFMRPFGALIQAALRASFRLINSNRALYSKSLTRHRAQNAAIPAVDSRRRVLAHMSGQRIVEMVHEDMKLSKILTKDAFENANPHQRRHRRIDQRRDSPARCRRTNWRAALSRRLGPPRTRGAYDCRSDALWPLRHPFNPRRLRTPRRHLCLYRARLGALVRHQRYLDVPYLAGVLASHGYAEEFAATG